VRGLSDYIRIEEIHFTQIRRRILKIKPSVGNLNLDNNDDNNPITVIVDASGLTITKKGDYIEQKWIRKRKEFIKLQIAVDAKSEKTFRVTKGNVHDSKKFSPMIREVSKEYTIDKAYADKAHDNRRSINLTIDGVGRSCNSYNIRIGICICNVKPSIWLSTRQRCSEFNYLEQSHL